MITGVFHFMAISFGLIFAGGKVGSPRKAVNQQHRHSLRQFFAILFALAAFGGASWDGSAAAAGASPRFAVLVFLKTAAFRHDSIPQGVAAIEALGTEHGFAVESTEDAARLGDVNLARYKAVVF